MKAKIGYDYVAEGKWNSKKNEYEVRYASILSKLIEQAGRWCENYSSDLFTHWDAIRKEFSFLHMDEETKCYMLGFRKNGVDIVHNTEKANLDEYRSIWAVEITYTGKELTMKLGRFH